MPFSFFCSSAACEIPKRRAISRFGRPAQTWGLPSQEYHSNEGRKCQRGNDGASARSDAEVATWAERTVDAEGSVASVEHGLTWNFRVGHPILWFRAASPNSRIAYHCVGVELAHGPPHIAELIAFGRDSFAPGSVTRNGWIGPRWIQTSPARKIFHRIRCSDRQIASNPRAGIPRVIIADRWDFFTLVAGSSIR